MLGKKSPLSHAHMGYKPRMNGGPAGRTDGGSGCGRVRAVAQRWAPRVGSSAEGCVPLAGHSGRVIRFRGCAQAQGPRAVS